MLATLYRSQHDENRVAWNRYFATRLYEIDEKLVARLIENKPRLECELKPFTPEELLKIEKDFAERSKASAQNVLLPNCDWTIRFDGVQFDKPVTFEGFLFPDCTFEHAVFSPEVNARFRNATFSRWFSFKKATFYGQANFNGASFTGNDSPAREKDFSGATFHCEAFFEGASFAGKVYFEGTTFSDGTKFKAASFSDLADFVDATFSGQAEFDGAKFSWVKFDGKARFEKDVYFDGITFTGETNFKNATFEAVSSFVNTKMKYTTTFEGATFETAPPRFFGAELHEGTVWPASKDWPTPKKKDEAKEFVRAYERLKLEMDRLKKHEDELDFFALELQSRRVLQESVLKGSGLPIALYGALSDYGRSYARPLYALLAVAAVGTLVLLLSGALLAPWQSLGISVANTLNVFGFRKDFFDPHLFENLPAPLKILAAAQTILGTILLFLFGLGIRNKFRMK
ncbi:MAG: pentapeptide repeat-containing protein [Pseudomonadota bacterium]|nr:pentapeptide repeat-containing protein [Pseudomonadota bacterium]